MIIFLRNNQLNEDDDAALQFSAVQLSCIVSCLIQQESGAQLFRFAPACRR